MVAKRQEQETYQSKQDADVALRWSKVGRCGMDGCIDKALIGIKTSTGWLNVCKEHYATYWHTGNLKEKLEAAGK